MMKFVRLKNGAIRSVKTNKPTSRDDIRDYVKRGIQVSFIDKETNEDLRHTLFDREHASELTDELCDLVGLGPDEPLNKPKINKCRSCGVKTINRFRCVTCLDKIKSRVDGDYLYY